MKRNHIYISALLLTGLSLTSCGDFLDKEPLSQGTTAVAFKNPTQFNEAANAFYSHLPGYDNYDQNTDIGCLTSNGGGSAQEDDATWSKQYANIRQYNILLQKAEGYTGDKSALNNALGQTYFFRAYAYFDLLKKFGGVPVIDKVLDVTDNDELYGPRASRYEVAQHIFADLHEAIDKLPIERNIAESDKGHISKEAAEAFLGRVLLYEATWEKYVPSIGYDLDGDGQKEGAGTAKPEGYPSIQQMLTESKANSKAVMDEASQHGTYALFNSCDSLSYDYLFTLDDKGGNICNPWGVGKSANKEFIISKRYDYDLKRSNKNLGHIVYTWQCVHISAQFGESFLCRNGLPIRISRTGNMADAENNSEFLGWDTFMGEYVNRDMRFFGSTFLPDRPVWSNGTGRSLTALGQPYPTPQIPKCDPEKGDKKDATDPAYGDWRCITRPVLRNNAIHYDYGCRKYGPEGANRPTNTESADWPILRLAEVYLNYAEATCELQNGQISDEDLNISINLLRKRARVAPLTNELIAGVWDAGWWDWKQKKTVCHKMTMLDEIRRERACELFGEGFRLDDLKRWGEAKDHLTGTILGRHVLNTAYTKHKTKDVSYYGEPCYYPQKYPLLYGVYTGAGSEDPDYGRSIAVKSENLQFQNRDYLSPLPLKQIRKNPNLKQNPGW